MKRLVLAFALAACDDVDRYPVSPGGVGGTPFSSGTVRIDAAPPVDAGTDASLVDAAPFSDGGPFIDAGTTLPDSGTFP